MIQPITVVRYHTKTLHDQLEHCALNRNLMSPSVTHSIYINWLSRMACFYQHIDKALEPWRHHDKFSDYLPRPEIKCLEEDQRYWQLPSCNQALPELIEDYYQAVGLLYVVEGAHFGFRIINDHIARHLSLTSSTGLALLTYSQKHSKVYWQKLLALINTTEKDHHINLITRGARLGFNWAYQSLS